MSNENFIYSITPDVLVEGSFESYLSARAHIRGLRTLRYHTESTIKQESIGAHVGFMVGAAFLLYGNPSSALLKAIAFHDHAEQVTGDSPSPSKRVFPAIKSALTQAEALFSEEFHIPNGESELDPEDLRRLKVLDRISGIAFSAHELELGNKSVVHVLDNFLNYLGETLPTINELRFVGACIFDLTVPRSKVPTLNTGAVKTNAKLINHPEQGIVESFSRLVLEAYGRENRERERHEDA